VPHTPVLRVGEATSQFNLDMVLLLLLKFLRVPHTRLRALWRVRQDAQVNRKVHLI